MRIRAKTVILSILFLLLLVVIGGISAIGWQVVLGPKKRDVSATPFEKTEARVERGKYLVEGPAHCFFCHTEHDLSQPTFPSNIAKKGAGWELPIPELNNIASRNITPDVETGIGSWSDDEVARAIREGIRKDGTALFPVMPYIEYSSMDDEDVKAIVVYLRTLAPVRNQVPARNLPFPLEHIVKTIPKPITTPVKHASATPQERGSYLVTLAGCGGCHTIADDGVPRPGLAFGGGQKFDLPGGKIIHTLNITPDASGIQHYDEGLFIQVIRTGSLPGRMLSPVMPFEYFKNMSDEDLRDIFAYLRAQPPVKHRVSNTDPPTLCPVCNQQHGLGNLNVKTN
jgi:mono/diheme cytochrome c family protein